MSKLNKALDTNKEQVPNFLPASHEPKLFGCYVLQNVTTINGVRRTNSIAVSKNLKELIALTKRYPKIPYCANISLSMECKTEHFWIQYLTNKI